MDYLGRVGALKYKDYKKRFENLGEAFDKFFSIYLYSNSLRVEPAFSASGLPRVDEAELK
jgi:hypothetical protein